MVYFQINSIFIYLLVNITIYKLFVQNNYQNIKPSVEKNKTTTMCFFKDLSIHYALLLLLLLLFLLLLLL